MSGFFETYRAGEERRHKIVLRAILAVLALLVAAAVLYFVFRNYREEQRTKGFLKALGQKNYAAAYEYWGCSQSRPCHDYDYAHFLEDWGPASAHADVARARITKTKSCDAGIIQFLEFPHDQVNLWVDRKTRVVGFAPWPVCYPRMQVPVSGQ